MKRTKFKKASDIRVGVIGYGGAFGMGKIHLDDMKKAGMTPVAVMELDEARLKVAEEEFPGIETYTSVAKMLKKSSVNLVTIITPHNTHAKLTLQCLRAGRHVVCEKPLAITTAECDAMVAEAKKQKVVLSAFHNRHWDGCILDVMRDVVRGGKIGDVVRIDAHMTDYNKPNPWWRDSKKISGGVLYDWGVHLLEYALQIVDSDIVEVTGFAKNGFWASKSSWGKDQNEDDAYAIVRFKNGICVTLHMSSIDANPRQGQLEIQGTKGTYVFDNKWHEMTRIVRGKPVVKREDNSPQQWPKYYKNIANHLVKGDKLIITPEWSRRPIHILDLAVKSAKQGRTLKAQHK